MAEKNELSGNLFIEDADKLIRDLRQIIDEARSRVAATANYELTMMYWHIGDRINRYVLGYERAEYGKKSLLKYSQI